MNPYIVKSRIQKCYNIEIALVSIHELISKIHTKKIKIQQKCIQSHAYTTFFGSYLIQIDIYLNKDI